MQDFQDICTYLKFYSKRIGGNKELTMMTPIDRLLGITRDQESGNKALIDFDGYFATSEEMQCLDMKKGNVTVPVLRD